MAGRRCSSARDLQEARRGVDAGDRGPGRGEQEGGVPGAATEVDDPLARPRRHEADDAMSGGEDLLGGAPRTAPDPSRSAHASADRVGGVRLRSIGYVAAMPERWFRQAVVYCLDVDTFQDSDG